MDGFSSNDCLGKTMSCRKIGLLLLLAFVVRAIYAIIFFEPSHLEAEDQLIYLSLADSLAKQGWTAFSPERVPGYPAFLATIFSVFEKNYLILQLIQGSIDSVTCVVIGAIAQRVLGRGFVLATLLAAFNLNMIVLSGMALTDSLFLFFFSFSLLYSVICIIEKSPCCLLLAITLLIIATMVRSVSYYLIPLALILLMLNSVLRGNRVKASLLSGALCLVITIVILFPQYWQNWKKYGEFGFVSQGGVHLLGWVVPAVHQYSGMGSYEAGQKLAREKLDASMEDDQINGFSGNPFKESHYKTSVAKEILKEMGPFSVLKAWAVGAAINLIVPSAAFAPVVRSFDHPSFYATPGNGALEKLSNYIADSSGFLYIAILASGALCSLLFLVLFLWGCYLILAGNNYGRKDCAIFLLCVAFYFLAITGPIIGSKYRLPIEPIITVFVTLSILRIFEKKDVNS